MVKGSALTSRDWVHEHSGPICTAVMVLGWLLLGSFAYDLLVRDAFSWWKLLISAPMVIGGWCYIVRQD